jgi:hypothetical protein
MKDGSEKKGRHDRQAARQRQSVLAGTRSRICHSMSGDSTVAAETIERLLVGSISMVPYPTLLPCRRLCETYKVAH